jgi:uncharacterized protein YcfJ
MKTLISIASIVALVLLAPAIHASQVFEDYARVTQVTPQYENVNLPRKECVSEYVPERRGRHGSLAGPLIGGIAGGILGAQVGSGNGRVAASAAGAAIGAVVGDRMSDRGGDEYYEREVRRCRLVDHWETRVVGYEVDFRYRGHTQTAILPYDPGRKLLLRVAIEPISRTGSSDDIWDQ